MNFIELKGDVFNLDQVCHAKLVTARDSRAKDGKSHWIMLVQQNGDERVVSYDDPAYRDEDFKKEVLRAPLLDLLGNGRDGINLALICNVSLRVNAVLRNKPKIESDEPEVEPNIYEIVFSFGAHEFALSYKNELKRAEQFKNIKGVLQVRRG